MASSQYCRAGPVIFTLTPLTTASMDVQDDFHNRRFCKRPGQQTPSGEIYITYNPHRREGIYPSTIGRTGHIKVREGFPANIQCAFEIHKDTGEVMLVDKSPDQNCYVRYTTKVFDEVLDFRNFGAMVICPHAVETILHFGERGSSTWMEWAIDWKLPGPIDMQAWATKVGFHDRIGQRMEPRSIPPTRRLDFDGANRENRYLPRDSIKDDDLSMVTKGIDALTGHLVIIKTVIDGKQSHDRLEGEARKELTTDLNHPHVMEFLQVRIMGDHFYLVMELQDGDVYELARSERFAETRGLFQPGENVGRPLMHQMLQALDYLSLNAIIHRNIEPKNILYRRIDKYTYHYRLADFSVSTTAPHPRHGEEISLFMAPEVEDLDRDYPHTTKIDIWSLCLSFCCIFDFYLTYGNKVFDKHGRVHSDWIPVLEAMVVDDPKDRVSAGDVLTEMFEGMGRVTNAE